MSDDRNCGVIMRRNGTRWQHDQDLAEQMPLTILPRLRIVSPLSDDFDLLGPMNPLLSARRSRYLGHASAYSFLQKFVSKQFFIRPYCTGSYGRTEPEPTIVLPMCRLFLGGVVLLARRGRLDVVNRPWRLQPSLVLRPPSTRHRERRLVLDA